MTFFKRLFSADFRRAISAEAAGDYTEAARAYALAGETAKVAEMHLLRAARTPSSEARLQELRAAVRWADPEEPDGRTARRRVARALVTWARESGLVSDADKQVVREAAALFAEVGDHAGAGECHELIGDEMAAAEAYQRAGELEKLEAVLQREESRRKRSVRLGESFDEYRLQLAGGERDRALASLRDCIEAAPRDGDGGDGDRAGYRRMLEALEPRLLTASKVTVRQGTVEILYVGAFPLVLGREATCELALRDGGISRQHAEIALDGAGGFVLRDRGSKNGTRLGGVPIAEGGALPLVGRGEIGLGEICVIAFDAQPTLLDLRVTRGLDRGLTVRASPQPLAVADAADLRFVDGRPRLSAREGQPLKLNGVRAGGPAGVQLIRADVVEIGAVRLEVV
jgi:tetratricopeptide (TPR) repeat protein